MVLASLARCALVGLTKGRGVSGSGCRGSQAATVDLVLARKGKVRTPSLDNALGAAVGRRARDTLRCVPCPTARLRNTPAQAVGPEASQRPARRPSALWPRAAEAATRAAAAAARRRQQLPRPLSRATVTSILAPSCSTVSSRGRGPCTADRRRAEMRGLQPTQWTCQHFPLELLELLDDEIRAEPMPPNVKRALTY